MSSTPAVIVRKGGFLTSLAGGFFGLLITCVICGTGISIYALRIVDTKLDGAFEFGGNILGNLHRWQEALPPALADALADRREPAYREHVSYAVSITPEGYGRDSRRRVVFRVTNSGSQVISLMALNVVFKAEDGLPLGDFRSYCATPFAIDEGSWRGPLWPGDTREYVRIISNAPSAANVQAEIAELRVHAPQDAQPAAEPSS